jgi:hypothetical protein
VKRLTVTVVAVYWLMLLSGLVLYTALWTDDVAFVIPVWIGAIAGTLIGHGVGLARFRPQVLLIAAFATILFVGPHIPHDVDRARLWLAFFPALVCGYWSLGDRMALAAFWFPAMLWMLSILDHTDAPPGHTDASAIPSGSGLVLLGGLALLFVLFLRVREARRVALWRTVSVMPLATAGRALVLAEQPNLMVLRSGGAIAMFGVAFAATAWFAPKLWHREASDVAPIAYAPGTGLPCCPVTPTDVVHVKEYFKTRRGYDQPPPDVDSCRPCGATASVIEPSYLVDRPTVSGAPSGGVDDGLSSHGPYSYAPSRQDSEPSAAPPTMPDMPQIAPTIAPPMAPVIAVTPPAPPRPVLIPEVAPAPTPPPVPSVAPPAPPPPPPTPALTPLPTAAADARPYVPPPTSDPSIVRWVAIVVGALLLMQTMMLVLRPLRRLVTLRHLRRPYWTETVDQRVSNSWQLALIGLRDAGWRATDREAPREFAQRVRVDGIEDCAIILERARHGLSIDAADLDQMTTSADSAYRSARARIGIVARALSWLRSPLS